MEFPLLGVFFLRALMMFWVIVWTPLTELLLSINLVAWRILPTNISRQKAFRLDSAMRLVFLSILFWISLPSDSKSSRAPFFQPGSEVFCMLFGFGPLGGFLQHERNKYVD